MPSAKSPLNPFLGPYPIRIGEDFDLQCPDLYGHRTSGGESFRYALILINATIVLLFRVVCECRIGERLFQMLGQLPMEFRRIIRVIIR